MLPRSPLWLSAVHSQCYSMNPQSILTLSVNMNPQSILTLSVNMNPQSIPTLSVYICV